MLWYAFVFFEMFYWLNTLDDGLSLVEQLELKGSVFCAQALRGEELARSSKDLGQSVSIFSSQIQPSLRLAPDTPMQHFICY